MRSRTLATWMFGCVFLVGAGCGGSDGSGDDDNAGAVCGDGACNGGETATTCPADCSSGAVCGDHTCNGNENASSCPGDCPTNPVCGDHACNGNETTANCPGDCPCTPLSQTTDDSCTGENICINGACVSAFGRNYIITVGSGVLPENDANGESWDFPGGLPDPFVVLTINGAAVMTSTIDDTLMPMWNQSTQPTLIPAGTAFKIEVFDEDVAVNDLAWSRTINPLPIDFIRGGGVACTGGATLPGAEVDVFFTPN